MLHCGKLAMHFFLRFLEPAARRYTLLADRGLFWLGRRLVAGEGDDDDADDDDSEDCEDRGERRRRQPRLRRDRPAVGLAFARPAVAPLARHGADIVVGRGPAGAGGRRRKFLLVLHRGAPDSPSGWAPRSCSERTAT